MVKCNQNKNFEKFCRSDVCRKHKEFYPISELRILHISYIMSKYVHLIDIFGSFYNFHVLTLQNAETHPGRVPLNAEYAQYLQKG